MRRNRTLWLAAVWLPLLGAGVQFGAMRQSPLEKAIIMVIMATAMFVWNEVLPEKKRR